MVYRWIVWVTLCLLLGWLTLPVVAARGPSLPSSPLRPAPSFAPTALGATTFPICEDFESGTLPSFMFTEATTVNGGSAGRARVVQRFAHESAYAFHLDTQPIGLGGFTRQAGVLQVDMSGVTEAEISFWLRGQGGSTSAQNGLFLSDDGGSTYEPIYPFPTGRFPYRPVYLDLLAEAATAGINTNGVVFIKFQSYGSGAIPNQGYTLDDICIRMPVVFVDGLKSAPLAVRPGGIIPYTISLVNQGILTATALTLVDPLPASTTYIAGSATNGATYDPGSHEIRWVGTLAPGAETTIRFAVTAPSTPAVVDNTATISDSRMVAPLLLAARTFVMIGALGDPSDPNPIYCAGFESGTLPPQMLTLVTADDGATGRANVRALHPHQGSYAFHLDSSRYIYPHTTQESGILVADLAGATEIELSFWYLSQWFQTGSVAISDDGGATYSTVYSLDSRTNTGYEQVVIDLDEAAAAAGRTLTNSFLIRFQGTTWADIQRFGYSLDDICLRPPSPVVEAEKAALPGIFVGNSLPYTVTMENIGTLTATAVSLTDPLPADTTLVAGSVSNGAVYNAALNQLEWAAPVAPQGSEEVSFRVAPLPTAGILVTNTGTVSHTALPAPHTVSATTKLIAAAELPACEGFETGNLPPWMFAEITRYRNAVGQVHVRPQLPHSGSHALSLYEPESYTKRVRAAVVLGANLANHPGATLSFWTLGEASSISDPRNDGVFISNDGGVTYHKIYDLAPSYPTYSQIVVDIGAGAAEAGIPLTDNFLIKLQLEGIRQGFLEGPRQALRVDDLCLYPAVTELGVSKASSGSSLTGHPITYTIELTNLSSTLAPDVVVQDPLPEGTIYVPGSATNGATYNAALNRVDWQGTLSAAARQTFTFQVTPTIAAGFIENTAVVTQTNLPAPLEAHNLTQIGAACGPMDVVFILDITDSMGGALDNVKREVATLVRLVEEFSGADYQMGLVTFSDTLTVHEDMAFGNGAAMRSALLALTIRSGNGTAEASDEALNTVIHGLDASDRPPGAQVGDFSDLWRPDADRIIFLVTDAPPGGFDDTYTVGVDDVHAHAQALAAANRGIRIAAVYVPTAFDALARTVMEDYATTTEGIFNQTLSDGEGTANALGAAIATCGESRIDLMLDKTDTVDPVFAGQPFAYHLTVTNYGPQTATAVLLTDTLPVELILLEGSSDCTLAGVCGVGSLAPLASHTFILTVTSPMTASGLVTNTAIVRANEEELNLVNNFSLEPTLIQDATAATIGSVGLGERWRGGGLLWGALALAGTLAWWVARRRQLRP